MFVVLGKSIMKLQSVPDHIIYMWRKSTKAGKYKEVLPKDP